MNKKLILTVLYFSLGFACFQKFYTDAKHFKPTKPYAVVMDAKDKNYPLNIKFDGNLDGKITVGEMQRASAFLKNDPNFIEKFNFVKKLNSVDRRVIQGLSYEVAKKAILLPKEQKYKYANHNIDQAEKVNEINAIFKKK